MSTLYKAIELTYIVPVYLENSSCEILKLLIGRYEQYSDELLDKIHFIFIDDCSPAEVKINTSKLNYTLARITDDIAWNQPGARNLGAFLAKSCKLLLTDLDHFFPETTLEHLISRKIPDDIFQFRRLKEGKKIHSHPCTFFLSKATFYKSLGFDEEFSRNYGNDDIYFLELQKKLKTGIKKIRRYPVEVNEYKDKDKETKDHFLERDTNHNRKLIEHKRKHILSDNPFKGHSRMHINFEWNIISENIRVN